MTEEGAPEAARETEAAADAISEPPEPGLDVGGDGGAADGASGFGGIGSGCWGAATGATRSSGNRSRR